MKLNAVNSSTKNLAINSVIKKQIYFKGYICKQDSVDFSSDKASFLDFCKLARRAKIQTAQDLSQNLREENLIGKGSHSKVYKFDSSDLDGYVIKIAKRNFDFSCSADTFEEVKDEFPNQNFGQPVAKMGNYLILKKINGEAHCPKWSDFINARALISKKDAREFKKTLTKIANFPMESYVEYARSQAILSEKGYKQDSMNPNNIIIDFKNKKINIIDYYRSRSSSGCNSSYDLSNCLLAFSVFPQFFEKLNMFDKKSLLRSANKIVEKCFEASKIAGVSIDEGLYIKYLTNVDNIFDDEIPDKQGDYRSRHNKVKKLLKSV